MNMDKFVMCRNYRFWENVRRELAKSKFRKKFKLCRNDFLYIKKNGIDVIKNHAYDFIVKRLAPAEIKNDGKQTPWSGHPVFTAQHATATCCRKCIEKWYGIERNVYLKEKQIKYVHYIIMSWIVEQYNNECNPGSKI
ncbi:MAG: DUF4186 domain-containing protein [Victivallales bacterium]|nr:DUF4186 domain-containing protein [Victivallales bacterium]